MNERGAALGFFHVYSGPLLLDKIESLPVGDSDRSLEIRFGLLASWVLARHGLEVTPSSRLVLLRQVAEAALDAGWAMKRATQGDYTPDPKANRFPALTPTNSAPSVTFQALFESWQAEAKPSPSTLATWRPILGSLQKYVGHDNAVRLEMSEVVGWKNNLIQTGLAASTINNTYLACLRAVLANGKANQLIAQNVAIGVRVREKRVAGKGRLPYNDQEVATLLRLAAEQTNSARRWIPLLAACTGARAGELAQLWAERVRDRNGILILDLKPAEDGGTFKNAGSEREVPMHPALIEAGFFDFARNKKTGPLFYGRSRGQGERHASKGTVNHLAAWIRKQQGFDDPRKAPTHAFRHWWKTKASRAGLSDSQADFIQGHQAGEPGKYRHHDYNLDVIAREIARISIPQIVAESSDCIE